MFCNHTAPQPHPNQPSGKTTVARLYHRLLKDLGVFAAAEQKAQEARQAAEAAATKKANAAEKAKRDAERRAFQSAGLPYTESTARASAPTFSTAGSGTAASSATSAGSSRSVAATDGFVETTGAALADKGVAGLKEMLEKIRKAGGGVLFVDEVRLDPLRTAGGCYFRVLNGCSVMGHRRNYCRFLPFLVGAARMVKTGRKNVWQLFPGSYTAPCRRSVGLTVQMLRNPAERCITRLVPMRPVCQFIFHHLYVTGRESREYNQFCVHSPMLT